MFIFFFIFFIYVENFCMLNLTYCLLKIWDGSVDSTWHTSWREDDEKFYF